MTILLINVDDFNDVMVITIICYSVITMNLHHEGYRKKVLKVTKYVRRGEALWPTGN